jgi:hypothetical protein
VHSRLVTRSGCRQGPASSRQAAAGPISTRQRYGKKFLDFPFVVFWSDQLTNKGSRIQGLFIEVLPMLASFPFIHWLLHSGGWPGVKDRVVGEESFRHLMVGQTNHLMLMPLIFNQINY